MGEHVHDGQIRFTDALIDMVEDWTSVRGDQVSEADKDLASGLVELINDLERDYPLFDEQARAYVSMALGAGRPAWASAGRAVWALALWRHGDEDSALLQLVRAELELAEELRKPWVVRDPEGGPTGAGAASNNLGAAYTLMRMLELADPHLKRAAEISQAVYGPDLRFQVLIDHLNLAESDVRWSLHAEAVGRVNESLQRAQSAEQYAKRSADIARDQHVVEALRYAEVLQIAVRTVLDPDGLRHEDIDKIRLMLSEPAFGGEVAELIAWTTMARVGRLLADSDIVREAADRAASLNGPADRIMSTVAAREAALIEDPAPATWRLVRMLAGQSEASRRRAVSAYRSRLVMAGMEQRYEEVTAEKERLERALKQATGDVHAGGSGALRDSLTGLATRDVFLAQVDTALTQARADGSLVAVAFIDVDGLTGLNETHGHEAGDGVLRWVADRLQASIRPQEVAARVGGDEFAVLMAGTQDARSIHGWAGRINDDLNDLDAHNSRPYPVTVRIGACIVTGSHDVSARELLARANGQLTEARKTGRNGAQVIVLGE